MIVTRRCAVISAFAFLLLAGLLIGCQRHTPGVANQNAPEIAFDRIVFDRYSGAFSPDPTYTIIIDRQGKAQLFGCESVPLEGVFKGSVSNDDLTSLSHFLTTHDFFRGKESHEAIDAPGIRFDIRVSGLHIKVNTFYDTEAPLPADLYEFGKIVDGITFTTRWYGRPAAPAFSSFTGRTKSVRLSKNAVRVQLPTGCYVP